MTLVMMDTLMYMRGETFEDKGDLWDSDDHLRVYQSWLVFEITLRVAIMLSYMLYIATRMFSRERVKVSFRTYLESEMKIHEDKNAYLDFLYKSRKYA